VFLIRAAIARAQHFVNWHDQPILLFTALKSSEQLRLRAAQPAALDLVNNPEPIFIVERQFKNAIATP
jgi:hypothetical protein